MNGSRPRYYAMTILWLGLASGCATLPPCSTPQTTASETTIPTPAQPTFALQQRVKEQDRRIAELTMQLNMLKHIDQSRMKDR